MRSSTGLFAPGFLFRWKAFPVLVALGFFVICTQILQPFAVLPVQAASISKIINFQGKITNATGGTNVTDGTYAMQFKFYDSLGSGSPPTGGTLLWTETYDQPSGACAKPTLTSGVFSVKLGSCNALTSVDFTTGSLYLSVNFAPTGTSYDGEMAPRKQLNATAYAFSANNLGGDGLINLAYAPGTTTNAAASIAYNPSVSSSNNALALSANSNVTGAAALITQAGTGVGIELAGAGTNARTINSTGSALVLKTTTSGNITLSPASGIVSGSGALTIQSGGATALTLDAGGASTINIGTGTSGRTINIGTDNTTADTITIGSPLDTIKLAKFATANGVLYISAVDGTVSETAASTGAQCLISASTGAAPTWGSCGGGSSPFTTTTGTISQTTSTDQLNLVMGQAGDYGLRVSTSVAPTADLVQIDTTANPVAAGNSAALISTIKTATGAGTNNSALKAVIGNAPVDASDIINGLEVTGSAQTVASTSQNLIRLTPASSGNTAGTLAGLQIDTITTPNTATETAINIGSGWDSALVVSGNPSASTTASQIQLGAAIAAGSSNGTFIGANPASFSGDFINLQNNGAQILNVTSTGNVISKTSTNSSTAFQVQNSAGAPLFLVDTTSTDPAAAQVNYLTYAGFESGSFSNAAAGWAATGSTLTQNTNKQHTFNGLFSAQVVSTATAQGLHTGSFLAAPPGSTSYIVSFYAKISTGTIASTAFTVTTTGGAGTCSPAAGITINSSGFQRLSCTVAAGAGTITDLQITQTSGANTIFYDSIQMQKTTYNGNTISAPTAYQIGELQLRGIITNPVTLQNNGDSNNAFQIQNANGNSNLFIADTLNSTISLNSNNAGTTLFNVTNNTASFTGTGLAITTNGQTSGTGLNISSTATGQTGNSMIVTTASTSAPTAGLVRFNFAGIRTAAGNGFQIDDASTTLATAMQLNANSLTTGNGLAISATATGLTGTALSVTTGSTGVPSNGLVRFNFNGNRTAAGAGFQIDDISTTLATTMQINANALTSGVGLNISLNALTSGIGLSVGGTGTGVTGNILLVKSASTSAVTNGLARFNFTGAHTGNGAQVDDVTLTGNAVQINANGIRTAGSALSIASTGITGAGGTTSAAGITISMPSVTVTTALRYIRFANAAGTEIGSITNSSASGVVLNATSDRRLKDNIVETHYGLTDLMKVGVRDFTWKEGGPADTGFIAQELYNVFPIAVLKGDNGTDPYIPGVTNTWGVDYSKVTPLIIKAVQDQQGLLGDFATKDTPGLSTLVTDISAGKFVDPATVLAGKIANGQNFLTNFFAARISGINGSFEQVTAGLQITAPSVTATGLVVDTVTSLKDAITFSSDINLIGRPYFNSDTAGFAIIKQGAQSVNITFDKNYIDPPIVTAGISVGDPVGLKNVDTAHIQQDQLTQSLFDSGVQFVVTHTSENGFTILLNKPAPANIGFAWIALAVKNAKTFSSIDSSASNQSMSLNAGPSISTSSNTSAPIMQNQSESSADTAGQVAGDSTQVANPVMPDSGNANVTTPVSAPEDVAPATDDSSINVPPSTLPDSGSNQ